MGRKARLGVLVAAGASWLCGCDGTKPAPTVDEFQPTRPTNAGSISDAVRRAPARVLSARGGERPAEVAIDIPPGPPERLDDPTRRLVREYLDAMGRLNATLASLSDPSQAGETLERLTPMVDSWRGAMDYLMMVPEGVRTEIRREFGPRLIEVSDTLSANRRRLAGQPAYAPVLTLVGDVPVLEGREPTPVPLTGGAGGGQPGSGASASARAGEKP